MRLKSSSSQLGILQHSKLYPTMLKREEMVLELGHLVCKTAGGNLVILIMQPCTISTAIKQTHSSGLGLHEILFTCIAHNLVF